MYTVPTLPEAIAEQLDYMRRVAFRLTRDFENLDDYVQESYIACVTRISLCSGNFRQFCAQTTVYTVRTIRKRQLRERVKLCDNAILGSMFAALPDRDASKAIKSAWRQLSANHRKTLRLHFAGTLPSDQRMNLSRARKSLSLLLQAS